MTEKFLTVREEKRVQRLRVSFFTIKKEKKKNHPGLPFSFFEADMKKKVRIILSTDFFVSRGYSFRIFAWMKMEFSQVFFSRIFYTKGYKKKKKMIIIQIFLYKTLIKLLMKQIIYFWSKF